ncbi:MAG TPA: hypothetical protein VMQ44_03595, partial [Candidatus Saccharimonadales bacterium]|nr:hypothetical protein [Candidatus Saccharimonadales bacterium]
MKLRFECLVFQQGEFSEKVVGEQEFDDPTKAVRALASFAACQSVVRNDSSVIPIYSKGPMLYLPPTKGGYPS